MGDFDWRENPAEHEETRGEDETLNEQERAAAKRQGAVVDDADVRELRRAISDADFRKRMHLALDRVLDQRQKRRGCIGDRAAGGFPRRDDFWDSFLRGQR